MSSSYNDIAFKIAKTLALSHFCRTLANVFTIGDNESPLVALAIWFAPSAPKAEALVHLAAQFAVGTYVVTESLYPRHVDTTLLAVR